MIKKWYKNEARAEKDATKYNCDICVGMNSYISGDIYYLVPRSAPCGIYRTIARANEEQGKSRVIYKYANGDVEVIPAVTDYRISVVRRGKIPEEKISDYLYGYYTRREEYSPTIKLRKEAARYSHFVCDVGGAEGHAERQRIRRDFMRGVRE